MAFEINDKLQTEKIKNKNDFHRLDALRYLMCGMVFGNSRSMIAFAG
jgi:hypothetical protein